MTDPIPSLLPAKSGHHFVIYGDSCSGVPGAPHEKTFASVNAVVRRLHPPPQFVIFPGDEVVGLTGDAGALRMQWHHWLDHEMGWLDRRAVPLWHTTSNHTTYDEMSENIFREVLKLPRNGPPGQEGLSYWVRRGDLLLVFVHTGWTGLGGEGHVETDWLEATLREQRDARHKLVLGHHPVFPVNGFSGSYQREIGHEYRDRFWDILVREGVAAYVCSHILAFDVQVHRGVLQICSAGAGTAHRMPEGVEYLHCVQAALDNEGLRYQVLDIEGVVRERLQWPLPRAADGEWRDLPRGTCSAPLVGLPPAGTVVALRLSGRTAPASAAAPQTIISAFSPGGAAPLWLGLRGPKQTLTLILGLDPRPGRSPHYWLGPDLLPERDFTLDLCFFPDMGPGGVLWRRRDDERWTSFAAAAATGLERLFWPLFWSVGQGQRGPTDQPYAGPRLDAAVAVMSQA